MAAKRLNISVSEDLAGRLNGRKDLNVSQVAAAALERHLSGSTVEKELSRLRSENKRLKSCLRKIAGMVIAYGSAQ